MPRLPFAAPDDERRKNSAAAPPDRALTVTAAAAMLKGVLAAHLPTRLRVVGEISNFSARAAGGHWFFSMKDEGACLRCVMFATSARRVSFPVRDGLQVVATGRIDLYEAQGHVQLYVESLAPVGEGALELALRALMAELRERGYFALERKKPLPVMPRRVAVVTSRHAAALQDVIDTAARRWGGCELLLLDVRVQGAEAASQIAAAIDALSRDAARLGIDALILTRGGGSIEDLWAFNERVVADALYRCSLPVVAAIGHETDTTIAELVADVRCATPTQAAMTLIPDQATLRHQLDQLADRLALTTGREVRSRRQHLESLARHPMFRTPRHALTPARRRLDELERAIVGATRRLLHDRRAALDALARQPVFRCPRLLTTAAADRFNQLEQELGHAARRAVAAQRQRLAALTRQLEAISPDRVLERGYSYTLGPDGRLLRRAADAVAGMKLTTFLHDGAVRSTVDGGGSVTLPPWLAGSSRPRRWRGVRRRAASDQPRLFDR